MGLSYLVFKGIMKKGYKVLIFIQRKIILVILDGKDVVVMVWMGSGKIVCFFFLMFEWFKIYSVQIGVCVFIFLLI